ncbi:MAG: uroporphyrinogen-III synthase [Verrucomicrobiota bacterium]|nr:uroporphyrinogen-III synthase [Verrucomicrobiota bacterium]
MNMLYLGLDPPPGVFHYPVIATERLDTPLLLDAIARLNEFTHLIFTSKRAVLHWGESSEFVPVCVAIGEGTARVLRTKGKEPLVAQEAIQEGVAILVEQILLENPNSSFLYPHSLQARSFLREFLHSKGVKFLAFPLYRTLLIRKEPVPNPLDFEEVFFTSPSTVDGFLQIFGSLPQGPRLKAIGPVTEAYLNLCLGKSLFNI